MYMDIALIVLGITAGVVSGLIGVGGGVLIVPVLVLLFHFSQKEAQGTTLALLVPPIGIFAAMTYYKAGYVNVKAATLIIVGFIIGSIFGAKLAVHMPTATSERVFGVFMLLVSIKLIIGL